MVRVSSPEYPAWLRASRVDANLTQKDLAKRLGVSMRAIQTWESGDRRPLPQHRRALAEFFSEELAA
jgi:transcriptional regulator with XRE-family HTH domain